MVATVCGVKLSSDVVPTECEMKFDSDGASTECEMKFGSDVVATECDDVSTSTPLTAAGITVDDIAIEEALAEEVDAIGEVKVSMATSAGRLIDDLPKLLRV